MTKKQGRPSLYREEYAKQAEKLCRLGATDKDMADFFEVATSTLYLWKNEQPAFSEAIKSGKLLADANVADRLFQRAMGYSHASEKVFQHQGQIVRAETVEHYPPDTTACIFWLKNRQPSLWRDRVEHTGKDGAPIEVADVSERDIAQRAAYLLNRGLQAGQTKH